MKRIKIFFFIFISLIVTAVEVFFHNLPSIETMRANELLKNEQIVERIGNDCIEKASYMGAGEKFAICQSISPDMSTSFDDIVYDTSDQIVLPPDRRSDLGKYTVLMEYGASQLKVAHIEDHFYAVSFSFSDSGDITMIDFQKRTKCPLAGFTFHIFKCENYTPPK